MSLKIQIPLNLLLLLGGYPREYKVQYNEPKHSATDGNRGNFNTNNFAKKYNLGKPIAGNFFQAQWDDYVPTAHKKLGF